MSADEVNIEPTVIRLGDDPPEPNRYVLDGEIWHEQWRQVGDQWECKSETLIAKAVFPEATIRVIGSGGYGVVYRYLDRQRREDHRTIDASAWIGGGRKDAADAADNGVQISPGCGRQFVHALGAWAQHAQGVDEVTVVRSPGWYEDDGRRVFVNGSNVVGADWVAEGEHTRCRGRKNGTLKEWSLAVRRLCTTPLLTLQVGASFAGALLRVLGRDPFILHLAGPSSSGKTRSLYMATSAWSAPEDLIQSWNGTKSGHENAAAMSSGACFVLDEIQQCDPSHVREFVYGFADGTGRRRADRSGTSNRETSTWSCIGLSTGENTVTDWIGSGVQGGLTVRMIDIPVERGDITTSREHAEEIRRTFGGVYGHAGEAFVEYLIEHDWEELRTRYENLALRLAEDISDGENVRICEQMAVIYLALQLVREAEIVAFEENEIDEAMTFVRDRALSHRGSSTSPEARAWEAIQMAIQSQPGSWPVDEDYNGSKNAYGVRGDGILYTTSSMLKASGLCQAAGCSPKQLLDWLESQGLCVAPTGSTRVGGNKQRWYVLHLQGEDEEPPHEESGADEEDAAVEPTEPDDDDDTDQEVKPSGAEETQAEAAAETPASLPEWKARLERERAMKDMVGDIDLL